MNKLQAWYDVFITYRWGFADDLLVVGMYEAFTNHSIDSDGNREIKVVLRNESILWISLN
jgi:hypothetical protein